MAPLQPQTKKWQIFSNRHFKVSIEQIKGPLPLSTHAQRFAWQLPKLTESETQRALEALNPNKGAGSGGLFPKALKTLSPYIAPTLSRIFNLSLQAPQIPDDWHHAIVAPVAKTPRTADPNLFRPISLTSVVCKVLEAILKEKTLAHLSQFSLLTSRQHGFLLVAEELITNCSTMVVRLT